MILPLNATKAVNKSSLRKYLYVDSPFLTIHEASIDKFVSFSALVLLTFIDIVQFAESQFSDIPCPYSLQKLRKELEETQLKLAEAKAKVQSLESKNGWFERRLAETEVCC